MKNAVDLRLAFAACFAILVPAVAGAQEAGANVAIQWNQAALQGVRDSKLGPPMVSRALAIVHTCMYDAWAAYDPLRSEPGLAGRSGRRRPVGLRRIVPRRSASPRFARSPTCSRRTKIPYSAR